MDTSLINAVTLGSPEAIGKLLKAGADIEARDKTPSTPLGWAAFSNENPAVIEVLLKAGADIEARGGAGRLGVPEGSSWTPPTSTLWMADVPFAGLFLAGPIAMAWWIVYF